MAHKITDDCITCGSCQPTCPVSAISAGEKKYVINPDVCVDCGTCVDACPSSAIVPEPKK